MGVGYGVGAEVGEKVPVVPTTKLDPSAKVSCTSPCKTTFVPSEYVDSVCVKVTILLPDKVVTMPDAGHTLSVQSVVQCASQTFS